MAQQEDNKDITLNDLLELVDTAARAIERLQSANASLAKQMRECESVARAAVIDAESKSRQIEELEQSEAALRRDAEWCRWFKNKYGSATFFSHIEREYLNEQGEQGSEQAGEGGHVMRVEGGNASSPAERASGTGPELS